MDGDVMRRSAGVRRETESRALQYLTESPGIVRTHRGSPT